MPPQVWRVVTPCAGWSGRRVPLLSTHVCVFVYHEGMPNILTDRERQLLDRARELADLQDEGAIRRAIGTRATDPAMVYSEAFGAAQHLLTELAALVYLKAR